MHRFLATGGRGDPSPMWWRINASVERHAGLGNDPGKSSCVAMIPVGIEGGAFLHEDAFGDFYPRLAKDLCCPSQMTLVRIPGSVDDPGDPRRDDRSGAGGGLSVGGAGLQGDVEGGACGWELGVRS